MGAVSSAARRSGTRAWWAGALVAVSCAGLWSSAQAAQHESAMAPSTCAATGLDTSNLVDWSAEISGFAVTGVELVAVPAGCEGRVAVVTVHDEDGDVLGSATGPLVAGGVVALPAHVPADGVAVVRTSILG